MDQQGQNGLLTTYREPYRRGGAVAWLVAIGLTTFYVLLYFADDLGFAGFDRVAHAVGLGNRWFLYGFLYCIAMAGGAVYYLRRHGNSRYNRVRIAVNVGVQVVLGFSLPFVMKLAGGNDYYFSYLWPLKWDALFPDTLRYYGAFIAAFALLGAFVLSPVLAVFFGKRWYCSWVCGCGGLANTFGDPWRHLTSKSSRAWRFEKVSVHAVLVLVIVVTAMVVADSWLGLRSGAFHSTALGLRRFYGFAIGAVLAGVVGVGLYPLFGPRVWCRNFCPMAAMLGLLQKLGRFRIRVKPDMCISCGNCSTYCEMGIDVRAYAQRNESFTRAACVGCGMCAHVCPRGVLKLENATLAGKGRPRQRLPVIGS